MNDEIRYPHRPKRSWREPSLTERLEMIRKQIKLNDEKPTDLMWCERDTVLRHRESVIMTQIEMEKSNDGSPSTSQMSR